MEKERERGKTVSPTKGKNANHASIMIGIKKYHNKLKDIKHMNNYKVGMIVKFLLKLIIWIPADLEEMIE